jgi:hypothetical protein
MRSPRNLIEKFEAQMDHVSSVWSILDAVVAGLSGVRNIIENKIGAVSKKKWLLSLLNIGNLASSANVANNILGVAKTFDDDGGVTIYGTAGWLMGTRRFGSLYAGAGLTIGSLLLPIIGLKDAEMVAVHNSKVAGLINATVEAGKRAELISYNDTDVAARVGELKLTAPHIEIGEFTPIAPTQFKTNIVKVNSNSQVNISTDPSTKDQTFSAGVHIDSKAVLEQRAQDKILIGSKKEIEVKVDDQTSIKIVAKGNVITIKAKNALLRLSPDNCIELTAGTGGGVTIRRDEIWAGFGESSKIHVTRSGNNKITGKKINLG